MKNVILTFFVLFSSLFSQEVIDKIIAIVGDEIILKSELDMQVNYLAMTQKLNPHSMRN